MWVRRFRFSGPGGWQGLDHGAWDSDPTLIVLFGATDHLKAADVYRQLSRRFPQAISLGCSTGTVVDGDQIDGCDITALAIGFARTQVRLAACDIATNSASRLAGSTIGAQLRADDLVGVFVLSDGLGVNGSELVSGLVEEIGSHVTLSGGLAGDGARFAETLLIANDAAAAGRVAAVGFYGDHIRMAHGSTGGWDVFGPNRRITSAVGNVLFELDGKPALDLYERYLGDEAADLPASGLLYPLNVWDPTNPADQVVRTILSVDRDTRSMTFAGDMPEGWSARLMRGTIDRLTEGAADAARHALKGLQEQGADPEVSLFVSCVGRRLLMGQHAGDEVEAVSNVLGKTVHQAGFYSYGEIAPQNGSGTCYLHNQTVTLTLLAEVA